MRRVTEVTRPKEDDSAEAAGEPARRSRRSRRRPAQVLLRRRPGRDRRAPGLRARPRRQTSFASCKFTDYTAEKVRTLYPRQPSCGSSGPIRRNAAEIIAKLEERGIDFDELRRGRATSPTPIRSTCSATWPSTPRLRTRRERADRLRKEKKDFFEQYGPEARAILNELLDKYAEHGTAQFVIPDVLKVPPISQHGNVIEIAEKFGGSDQLGMPSPAADPALRRMRR